MSESYHSYDDPYYAAIQATSLVEMLLYGGYLAVFYRCIQILNAIRRDKGTSHAYMTQTAYLFGILIILFLIASLNLATTVFCSFKQFFIFNNQLVYMPLGFTTIALPGNTMYLWVFTLKNTLFVIAILISDAFLVFRCYVVWNRRLKAAVFPLIAFMADIGIGGLFLFDTVYNVKISNLETYINFDSYYYKTVEYTFFASRVALFLVTISLNIICTFLIAFQIWKIQRRVHQKSSQSSYVRKAIVTIIESGAIYSVWMIAVLATYPLSTAYILFQDTTVQIIAITFSIIICRISRGENTGDSQMQDRSTRWSNTRLHSKPFVSSGSTPVSGFGKSASAQPVQIMIGRDVWHDDDIELGSHEHPSFQTSVISTHDTSIKMDSEIPVDTHV